MLGADVQPIDVVQLGGDLVVEGDGGTFPECGASVKGAVFDRVRRGLNASPDTVKRRFGIVLYRVVKLACALRQPDAGILELRYEARTELPGRINVSALEPPTSEFMNL